ncbi:ferrous iron transport protein A [Candidatus Woesearchaeota archaeon]|jgi:Fe2+ transport system protein FeoA|nr:ferrous iron transport protein A [Candidatus Woesearchaeota archaeon]
MFEQPEIIPLAKLRAGEKGQIVFTGNHGAGFLQHLYDMGINEGSEIEVITSGRPGPFLVRVANTSLAIGHGIARKIMVEQ